MSLSLQRCDYCKNLIEDDKRYICKAFPDGDGIPPEMIGESDEWEGECNNGYKFIMDETK